MSYFYRLPEFSRVDSFSLPCIESDHELLAEDLCAYMAEIERCEEFLKSIHVSWCRGLVLKGEGTTGDVVDRWCVAIPSSVSVMYWTKNGDGRLKLMYGRQLLIGGEGYIRKAAAVEEEVKPVIPVAAAKKVEPGNRQTAVHPEMRRPNPPPARIIEKKKPPVFTGTRTTGIPALDRVRGIKR